MRTSIVSLLLVSMSLAGSGAALCGEGWAKLTTADPSCPDDSGNRYVDCGNGTVTDNLTGLVWLRFADCFGAMPWLDAMTTMRGLSDTHCGLTDGSAPGDWRLPSYEELEAMLAPAFMACTPSITNDAGTGCWGDGPSSFFGIQDSAYWSATTTNFTHIAWYMDLHLGSGDGFVKTQSFYFWAVRGGQ